MTYLLWESTADGFRKIAAAGILGKIAAKLDVASGGPLKALPKPGMKAPIRKLPYEPATPPAPVPAPAKV